MFSSTEVLCFFIIDLLPVEDLGPKILLQIMDKKMKNHYQVPSIKVVSFKVEEGFVSPLQIGTTRVNGTETYDSESWTARPFQPQE